MNASIEVAPGRPHHQGASMFLSKDELVDLTERETSRYQIAWLNAHGYPYELSALGHPKVLRAYVAQHLGLASAVALQHTEPDFSAWKH